VIDHRYDRSILSLLHIASHQIDAYDVSGNLRFYYLKGAITVRAILLILVVLSTSLHAESITPKVWGYGIKSCTSYVEAYKAKESGKQEQVWEYFRYRDWFTGLVSGLTMATGIDVMQGVDPKSAMRRINLICEEDLGNDFFTATMEFVRVIGTSRSQDKVNTENGSK
jgi:hypothetical protein